MKGSKANISAEVTRASGEEIQFHEERDATDDPGDHDQEWESAMRCGLEETDVIAQMRVQREDHERIQATEKQTCQQSPAEAVR
jgi:hypothetical protein